MAFNLAALKGLFSKLKPAAKTIANYGDDAAKALTTYGDDVIQSARNMPSTELHKHVLYDRAVAHGAVPDKLDNLLKTDRFNKTKLPPFANADDLAAATAQTDNIAKRIRDADAPALTSTYDNPNGFDWDLIETSDDYGLSEFDFRLNGARNYNLGPTDDLISYLNNADSELAEIANLEQFDPDAYKSPLDSAPDYEAFTINPEDFYQRKDLIDSVDYPDGFTNPDDFARYYDSLELGYVPKEFNLDIDNDEFWRRAASDDRDDMALAYNLLKQQELHMPMSPQTFDQAHMLVKKRLEPGTWAVRNYSIPYRKYVRNAKDSGALYNLYEDILNYKKPW